MYCVDIAHAASGQHFQPPLHLARRIPQDVRCHFRIGHHGRQKVRNVRIKSQFELLRVDENELQFFRRRLVQHAHQQGIDKHALARSRRAGNQQVRHLRQVGCANPADKIFAQRHRELRRRMAEFGRLDDVAQRNRLAMRIRHFDPDRGFPGDALDQDRLGAQGQAKIFGKSCNAAVLDSRFGLEFERGDHRAGIDLRHLSIHFEFLAFELDRASIFLQLALRHFLAALGRLQQAGEGSR